MNKTKLYCNEFHLYKIPILKTLIPYNFVCHDVEYHISICNIILFDINKMNMRLWILLIVFIISVFLGLTFEISPKVLENFDIYKKDVNTIDSISCKNILENSIKNVDKKYENYIKSILISKKNDVINLIKFTDGSVKWSGWLLNENDTLLKELVNDMYLNMNKKLCDFNIKIIFQKLNKYRISLHNNSDIMLDIDYVFYKPNDYFAYHINIISVINKKTFNIYYLYVANIGQICEDKLDTSICTLPDNYVKVNFSNKNSLETTDNCLITEDNEVKNILSKNLEHDFLKENPDYIKNQQYNLDQKIIQNMFLNGLKKSEDCTVISTNKYKNFPYKSDIIIEDKDSYE